MSSHMKYFATYSGQLLIHEHHLLCGHITVSGTYWLIAKKYLTAVIFHAAMVRGLFERILSEIICRLHLQVLAHARHHVHGVFVSKAPGSCDPVLTCCEGGRPVCKPLVGIHAIR